MAMQTEVSKHTHPQKRTKPALVSHLRHVRHNGGVHILPERTMMLWRKDELESVHLRDHREEVA